MSVIFMPTEGWEFWLFAGALAVAGIAAFLVLMGLPRATMKLDNKWGYRKFSWIVFISLFFIVYGITGIPGLLLMFVCTGIGLMPVLFRSRRLNCMAVLLVPIFLNMAGFGPRIIEALGLVG